MIFTAVHVAIGCVQTIIDIRNGTLKSPYVSEEEAKAGNCSVLWRLAAIEASANMTVALLSPDAVRSAQALERSFEVVQRTATAIAEMGAAAVNAVETLDMER